MYNGQFTPELCAMVSQEYLDDKGSYAVLACKYNIGKSTIKRWVDLYRIHGINAFIRRPKHNAYTKEFKIMCVKAVLSGEGSSQYIASKYNFYHTVLDYWIRMYNANIELKDTVGKRGNYMAEAKRKTTEQERKTIVGYCIEHKWDYNTTAAVYDVTYSQVYSWVKRYEKYGEEGLADNRGHHKSDEEVDELERLRRENRRLKHQLKEREMAVELLKKVRELEGM